MEGVTNRVLEEDTKIFTKDLFLFGEARAEVGKQDGGFNWGNLLPSECFNFQLGFFIIVIAIFF